MKIQERNKSIIDLIKKAREEKKLTQKDIAERLNKTPAAISDLERYKVQISASELYEIADLLDKPIEYFYGENVGKKEAEEIISLARTQNNENGTSLMEDIKTTMKLSAVERKSKKYKKPEDMPDELLQEFYDAYYPYAMNINNKVRLTNELLKLFENEMNKRKMKFIKTIKK